MRLSRPARSAAWLVIAAVLVGATGGACGETTPGATPDAEAPPLDAPADSPRVDATPPIDAADRDADRDASGDASSDADANVGPTRAPFGLDARPPNPTCRLPNRPTAPRRGLRLTPVFEDAGVYQPIAMAQIPGDRSRFFFIERDGFMVSVTGPNATTKTVVATLPDTDAYGEGGLLGFAFHPRFAVNGYVYFSYTQSRGFEQLRSVIVRMKSRDNGATFGEMTTILGPFDQPDSNHNGGDLHFGPDGYLYASFGDGGGAGDPFGYGQRKDTFFSKILRIDVDTATPPNAYSIPDGNPWKSGGGEPATFAYGFRNPYRFSIDSVTGEVWAGDVGQDTWEEIDKVVAGGNYGWSQREGPDCYPAPTCSSAGFIEPVVSHNHADVFGAIIAGPVYRGTKMPARVGQLLYADLLGKMFSLSSDPATGSPISTLEADETVGAQWIGFAEDDAKEVYAFGYAGAVYAIDEGPIPPPPVAFPEKLSDTGCFEKTDPRRPVAALLPYAPNSPFWSDGAEKERYFAIPDGAKIAVDPTSGDFDFPIGSVLAKTFRIGGKLVETRLFARHDDGSWGGYSYEWNDAQSEATLLPAGKVKDIAGTAWTYPSRGECFSCHTAAAGRTLGLEVGQLNGDFVYARTNRVSNQLRTLDHLGVFASPLADPATLVAFPAPFAAPTPANLEARARSYLHANCSHCHRAGGPGRGNFELRYGPTLAASRMCGAAPLAGDLGVAGARIVDPGKPASSLLSLRLRAAAAGRMPPLATRKLDTQGAQLVDDWLRSLATCPP